MPDGIVRYIVHLSLGPLWWPALYSVLPTHPSIFHTMMVHFLHSYTLREWAGFVWCVDGWMDCRMQNADRRTAELWRGQWQASSDCTLFLSPYPVLSMLEGEVEKKTDYGLIQLLVGHQTVGGRRKGTLYTHTPAHPHPYPSARLTPTHIALAWPGLADPTRAKQL